VAKNHILMTINILPAEFGLKNIETIF